MTGEHPRLNLVETVREAEEKRPGNGLEMVAEELEFLREGHAKLADLTKRSNTLISAVDARTEGIAANLAEIREELAEFRSEVARRLDGLAEAFRNGRVR